MSEWISQGIELEKLSINVSASQCHDETFVDNIETDERDRVIVRGIVKVGEVMGMEVIAEGVERKEQLEILRNLGIRYVQGYLYSPPLEKDEFIAFCTSGKVKL